jgi:PAS domain S-box-containing protein
MIHPARDPHEDPVNILMVDDQPAKLLGYEAILEPLGETLLTASDGRQALEQLLKHDVAVILMDVCMPEQDGFELVELIRQHHRFRDTAVIFVSAIQITENEVVKGYASGGVDYVSVPVVPEILRAKVSVFVDLYRKTRALERLNSNLEAVVAERTAELRESEERFRIVADTIPSLVWTADASGNMTYANERCQEYLGEVEVGLGHQLLEAIHSDERKRCSQAWKTAIRTGAPFEIEHRTRRHDGQFLWYLSRALPLKDAEGRPVAWFGVSTEIEDQKRAERLIKESEQLYKAVGDSIDYGIWVADHEGRNSYASDSFLNLLGITQEECTQGLWADRHLPEEYAPTLEAWNECVRKGEPWSREHWFRGQDGEYHPVLSRGVPIRDHEGKVTAWVGINLDISQMKAAEEGLREADRRKDEFLATLAHELRNPLAPICSSVELLSMHENADPLVRQSLDMMNRQLGQMVRLINDLMDVSRITRNKIELQRERVPLADIMKLAVELSQPALEAGQHTLKVTIPDHSKVVNVDAARLAQVISNLLTNAAKYTPVNGAIALDARIAEREIVLQVQDNGIGLHPEDLPHLFDAFYQVDRSISRAQGGLGIGLTLVKKIVEMHDGSVEALSDGPGQGTTIIVRIPNGMARPKTSKRAPLSASTRAQGHRILVVDDNRDAAETLSLLLRHSGHEVRTSHDGGQALHDGEEFQPHVILMDLGMPGINGYQAAESIRSQPWGQGVVLVAVTGWGQPEDFAKTTAAGFDHHLVKPVDFAAVRSLLDLV